jgi:hypothetical protein
MRGNVDAVAVVDFISTASGNPRQRVRSPTAQQGDKFTRCAERHHIHRHGSRRSLVVKATHDRPLALAAQSRPGSSTGAIRRLAMHRSLGSIRLLSG